jgi:hypothetical protein
MCRSYPAYSSLDEATPLDQLVSGEIESTSEIAERENSSERSVRMTCCLLLLRGDRP